MTAEEQNPILQCTPEWYEARKKGLGASDAPAALGFSRWTTPQQVCLAKWGETDQQEETKATHRGKVLEPLLIDAYSQITGLEVTPGKMMFHEKLDMIFATPDGLLDYAKTPGLLQIKTTLDWLDDEWGEEGTDEIPHHYRIQVAHEMAVTNRDWVDVAVLIASEQVFDMLVHLCEQLGSDSEFLLEMVEGHLDFRIYTVERDLDLEEQIINAEVDFWDRYVVPHELPADISMVQPGTKEPRRASTQEAKQIDIARKHWLAMKRAERRLAAKKEILQQAIGTDYGIFCPDTKDKITWGKNKDTELTETDWCAVVSGLNEVLPEEHKQAFEKLIKNNTKTTTKPGSRVFRWPTKKWGQEL